MSEWEEFYDFLQLQSPIYTPEKQSFDPNFPFLRTD